MEPFFSADGFELYQGDCTSILPAISGVDMVFADPPYFLSNDGLTIQSGNIVSVNKGEWDKLKDTSVDDFNYKWIKAVREVLKPNGSIWISGTMHNTFSLYQTLTEFGFKVLNVITWKKTNPPPNFSCRCFTHSTEFVIWARKDPKKAHYFNYELMKALNGGKQMKDVWELPAIAPWEKKYGKHPTQKPLSVVVRTILASTHQGDLVLDPFTGSSTTGIGAYLFGRHFIGIDTQEEYLNISKERFLEATTNASMLRSKVYGITPEVVAEYDH